VAVCAASATLNVLAVVPGRVWKPMYCVLELPVSVVGEIGYLLTLIHTSPLSWQLEQPLVMPAWICAVVGTGVANLDPGAATAAFAGTNPAGIEPTWQLSQAVAEGMCELAPTGVVGGITMILVTPTNEAPVTVGPWQPTQVVRPAWLIAEFVNLAPSSTGVAATLEPAPMWQLSHAAVVGM
jgi:hypothetical protein